MGKEGGESSEPRLVRGPRGPRSELRKKLEESDHIRALVLEFLGVDEEQARRKTKLGTVVRRFLFCILDFLGFPLRWHDTKPGPGTQWHGNKEVAYFFFQDPGARKALDACLEHVEAGMKARFPERKWCFPRAAPTPASITPQSPKRASRSPKEPSIRDLTQV